MLIKIKDTSGEVYHINPQNVIYIKERPLHGLWKVAVVNGEMIMTKDSAKIKGIIDFLSQ